MCDYVSFTRIQQDRLEAMRRAAEQARYAPRRPVGLTLRRRLARAILSLANWIEPDRPASPRVT